MIEIALYQPDIAANAGSIGRLCACFGLRLTIIEPAGFVWTDSALRRAGMDYLNHLEVERMPSFAHFQAARAGKRLLLLTTKASQSYAGFTYAADDVLLLGRESAGVPDDVHACCTGLTIPMKHGLRSLNVAMAAAIVAGEAVRQLGIGAG
jgi:tRNA (cytidine/uridine-2'-O-)-methyltransferase